MRRPVPLALGGREPPCVAAGLEPGSTRRVEIISATSFCEAASSSDAEEKAEEAGCDGLQRALDELDGRAAAAACELDGLDAERDDGREDASAHDRYEAGGARPHELPHSGAQPPPVMPMPPIPPAPPDPIGTEEAPPLPREAAGPALGGRDGKRGAAQAERLADEGRLDGCDDAGCAGGSCRPAAPLQPPPLPAAAAGEGAIASFAPAPATPAAAEPPTGGACAAVLAGRNGAGACEEGPEGLLCGWRGEAGPLPRPCILLCSGWWAAGWADGLLGLSSP